MASVDKDTLNGVARTTDAHAGGQSELDASDGVFVFGPDAFPAFAMTSRPAMKTHPIDGAYGRAANAGGGLVGDGGFGNLWGVYGRVNCSNPNPGGVGVCGAAAMDLADPDNYTGIAGMFIGPVEVHADLTVLGNQVVWGTKSAAAKHTDGSYRLLYCVESAESQFEDFGEARLSKGRTKVRLDRDFAAVADTRHYHVFLTAYGDSNGLYVTKRTSQGFEVREQGGGTSGVR